MYMILLYVYTCTDKYIDPVIPVLTSVYYPVTCIPVLTSVYDPVIHVYLY